MIVNAFQSIKKCWHFDMDSLYCEHIDPKDKYLIYKNKAIDAKWVIIFGELETNSHMFKTVLLLVSKTLCPIQQSFLKRIFSLLA